MRTTRTSKLAASFHDENSHPNTSQTSKVAFSTKAKKLSSIAKTSPKNSIKWSTDETCKLMELFDKYEKDDALNSSIWDFISKKIKRSPGACRYKMRQLQSSGVMVASKKKNKNNNKNKELSENEKPIMEVASSPVRDTSSNESPEQEHQVQELKMTERIVVTASLKTNTEMNDSSNSDSSSSNDWSEDETQKLMSVLASIDQGVFDEIPRSTHTIWKKVAGKMDKRSPTECHEQMNKMGLESVLKARSTSGQSRRMWAKEESRKLEESYLKHCHIQEEAGAKAMWQVISKEFGRSAASCQSRYNSLKRKKKISFSNQKDGTPSENTSCKMEGLETTSSLEEKDLFGNTKRCKWTKEEERILLEFSEGKKVKNIDFAAIVKRIGKTHVACQQRIYYLRRSKKPKIEQISTKVNTMEVTMPREIPVNSSIEKISPLSSSSHTGDDISTTKGSMTNFDTPTKEMIGYVFDCDNNDNVDSKSFLSPQQAVRLYFSPFTPRAKSNNAAFQTTWTPLDKSASIDCSEILDWDSLEISSDNETMHTHEKTNKIDDLKDVTYEETKCDQDIALDRTPIVARTKRKFETRLYDDLHHPRSDPCHLTKLSVCYNCPNSVSAHSDPCYYGRSNYDEFAELGQLNTDSETPIYQPKKRSVGENKSYGQLHEEINLNIEADDYLDLDDMGYLTLDDFFS